MTKVRIRVESDEDAHRIGGVLEALGYEVIRDLDDADGPTRLKWAVDRLRQRNRLTEREADILALVLDGLNNEEISVRLKIVRAAVKWHMHNIFGKTDTGNREGLLRLAMQVGPTEDPRA